jgi:hypothetical protein
MVQLPVTWENTSLRKPIVYLKCRGTNLKALMQEETLSRSLVVETRCIPKPKLHMRIYPVKE